MADAPLDNDDYRAAVIDLLAVLAYGELSAFERLCDDAALAPTLGDKAEIAEMACAEFGHFQRLRRRLVDLGLGALFAVLGRRHPRRRPTGSRDS